MFPSRIQDELGLPRISRGAKWVIGLCVLVVYGALALNRSTGIPSLVEKWRQIRTLTEENAELARANKAQKEHIQRFKDTPAEQQQEIRKNLRMQRKGEKMFILPPPTQPLPEQVPTKKP